MEVAAVAGLDEVDDVAAVAEDPAAVEATMRGALLGPRSHLAGSSKADVPR